MGGKFDSLPNELSVGQQQKVAIARAIVKDPLLILADEPTVEMDPVSGREILQKLGELNRDLGISVVVASHGFNVMQQVQRTLFLKDGKVVDEKEAGY